MAAFRASSGPNTATLAPSCAPMAGGQRFKGPAWVWPRRAERWRKPAIIAVSVLGHAALFSYLGLRSMGLSIPDLLQDDAVIYVQMEPRPLLPGEVARVRPPPERTRDVAAPALPGTTTADRDLPFRDPTEDEDQPAPPAPRLGVPAPGAPAAPPGVEAGPCAPRPSATVSAAACAPAARAAALLPCSAPPSARSATSASASAPVPRLP